jgi:uncharacterized membrane protein YjjP (DUF1212 family)
LKYFLYAFALTFCKTKDNQGESESLNTVKLQRNEEKLGECSQHDRQYKGHQAGVAIGSLAGAVLFFFGGGPGITGVLLSGFIGGTAGGIY